MLEIAVGCDGLVKLVGDQFCLGVNCICVNTLSNSNFVLRGLAR